MRPGFEEKAMEKTLGVGVIGCGNISTAYMRLAPLFKGIEIRACADIDKAAAEARAAAFGLKAQSVDALLHNPDIDIVVNLTVPASHFAVSKACLEAGKHVYSEKPLTLSMAEADALQRLASKRKLAVAAAPDTFLGGAHQQARKAIDDGLIGKVASGTAHVMGHGMEHWHPNPDFFYKPGGGPILDMGPYYIANLINLVGPVKRVAALSSIPRRQRLISSGPRTGQKVSVKTPTTYHALLAFANGAMVTLSASWDVFAHRHPHMELYGTEGAIFVPDPNFFGGEVMVAGPDAKLRSLGPWDHPFGIANEGNPEGRHANYRTAGLADMAQGILRRRDIRCSIDRMAHVVDIMMSIVASGETGKFVEVKSTCTRPRYLGPEDARALLK
jgi:predicted dehydrogenase